jgi:biotin transport system substrate-specific component
MILKEPLNTILKIISGTALITLGARVSIPLPLSEVPATLQSLFVLLIPMVWGWRTGSLAVLLYLILGFAGLPVFSGGSAGLEKLWGPTGGFLLGFLIVAVLAGKISEKILSGWLWKGFLLLLAGHLVLFGIGFGWLGIQSNNPDMWINAIIPLFPGALMKSGAGAAIYAGIVHIRRDD